MTKNEIRNKLRDERDNLTSMQQKDYSNSINLRLFQTEAYKKCRMVFPYMSFRSEVDTGDIISKALADGKQVYLPRVMGNEMEFYRIKQLDGLLKSSYGILEPPVVENNRFVSTYEKAKTEAEDNESIRQKNQNQKDNSYDKLMLLPGLAFDLQGNRIGYGAGFYDKYLTAHAETEFYKLALAYDLQVLDEIEADRYDIKADAILTQSRLVVCR